MAIPEFNIYYVRLFMNNIIYEKIIQKILNLNFNIFVISILCNFLIFIDILNIFPVSIFMNELIVFLVNNSLFPNKTSSSLQLTLLFSLFLFFINLFLSIFLVWFYLKNDEQELFFDKLKDRNKILYALGFRTIYPNEYHKLIDNKSTFFKVASLFFYILVLFTALEWFIWFGVPLIPFWIFKLISSYQAFLFLWNIFLVIAIGFFCPSIIGLSIILVHSIFRKEL